MARVELMTWEQAQRSPAPCVSRSSSTSRNVPAGIELDDQDANCIHAVAFDAECTAIGTGRLLPDGHIGRMAVVMEWRRRGIGAEILEALIGEARKRGHAQVLVSAQLRAAEFYRAHGFDAEGKVYEEAGILHQQMCRKL